MSSFSPREPGQLCFLGQKAMALLGLQLKIAQTVVRFGSPTKCRFIPLHIVHSLPLIGCGVNIIADSWWSVYGVVNCHSLSVLSYYQQQLRQGSIASTNHMPLQPLTLTCQSLQCEWQAVWQRPHPSEQWLRQACGGFEVAVCVEGGMHTAKQDPSHGPHGVCVSSTQFQFNRPVRWLPAIRTLTHFH